MFAIFKHKLRVRKMRQLISAALDALYSEQPDVSSVAASLAAGKNGSDLVSTYISIDIATRLTQPLTDAVVKDATERLLAAEKHIDSTVFDTIIDIYKELVELHWLHKHEAILRGKLAHVNDERSFEGTIYRLQRDGKQPVNLDVRERSKELCGNMADINRQIEERELALLREQDAVEYARVKKEMEVRTLQEQVDALESTSSRRELDELTVMLEKKLDEVLQRPNDR